MPRARMRQSVRQNFSLEGTFEVAYRRTTFHLQLDTLRQEVHQERRIAASSANAHRGEEIRVLHVRQEVHEERSSDETHENPREEKEQEGVEQRELATNRANTELVSFRCRTVHHDLGSLHLESC